MHRQNRQVAGRAWRNITQVATQAVSDQLKSKPKTGLGGLNAESFFAKIRAKIHASYGLIRQVTN